jgi:hypothetical protein
MSGRKIGLRVHERLVLVSILPNQGNYIQLQVARGLASRVNLSAKEIESVELKADGPKISWNPEKDTPVEFEFNKVEEREIATALKKLDSESKLEPRHLELFDKFVGASNE